MRKPRKIAILSIAAILLLWFAFCLPDPLFDDPYSSILEDAEGKLLAGKIAADGQWRFPETDTLPEKFVKAITYFEDEYFFNHPGVNPVSLFRALKQNIESGKIVSGGSTLSMQTIRLSRKGRSRTLKEKAIEIIMALRMELTYSKEEILRLYASHAPFGGNVVGLEAASWRYYGRRPEHLSWSETCALAVLPNAPALIYPGRNQDKLRAKRNRLLDKLYQNGEIDKETSELARAEPLPGAPHPIPAFTPHLLERAIREDGAGKRTVITINALLQERVNKLVNDYHGVLSENEIHNLAALVLDVNTGAVLAYAGNSDCPAEGSGRDVDIIVSPRSTGSILKPFLYAFMLQDGAITPDALVPDVPTQIGGYSPENYETTYDGAVPASGALARSLNIPAVRMLQDYGLGKFYHQLKKMDFPTIDRPASHYGLSIILGGAEATLWDLCNEYMKMAQTLKDPGPGVSAPWYDKEAAPEPSIQPKVFTPGAVWWTFEALATLNRPDQETGWQEFQSAQKVAWKTGTSFGHRDAWAIGVTPDHVVGVWVGNADGEGRPGLTGVSVAAPVMFKIFKYLPYERWFERPEWDLQPAEICRQSGFLASPLCPDAREELLPEKALNTPACPYHKRVHLDQDRRFRVTSNCYPVRDMETVSWFVLPPVQEWYYKMKNPFYKELPPFRESCANEGQQNMAVIYPKEMTGILVPRELDGSLGRTVFEIAHRQADATVFWHLDNNYIGSTQTIHRMETAPDPGRHTMTLVDQSGESISWEFEVLKR